MPSPGLTDPLFHPLPSGSRSLTKQAADVLRGAIVSGRLEPGARIVEKEISEQLNVSRGPVREAIRELEQEGLLQSFPNRGAVVMGVTEAEVHGLLIPVRIAVEGFACVEGRRKLTSDDVETLEELIDDMRSGDLDRAVHADVAFHELLLERSGHLHAIQMWRLIAPRIRAYFYRHGVYSDGEKLAQEHQELLAVLLAGTDAVVGELLSRHIDVSWA